LPENVLQHGVMGSPDPEVGPLAAGLAFQQARPADDLDVAGDGRLRHLQDVGQFTDTQRAVHHQTDDTPARAVSQHTEKTNGIAHNEIDRHEIRRDVKPLTARWRSPAIPARNSCQMRKSLLAAFTPMNRLAWRGFTTDSATQPQDHDI
jgi:hypothetical protein